MLVCCTFCFCCYQEENIRVYQSSNQSKPLTNISGNVCPLWTKFSQSGHCECNITELDGLLRCSESKLSVLDCYCVTYDNATCQFMVGTCILNCVGVKKKRNKLYHPEFNGVDRINERMCEKNFNREGPLCGKCQRGFYPLAYSFNRSCVRCPGGNRGNIWKYFLIALGPLTLFYLLVLFFKINTTSSHLHGYIFFAQTLSISSLGFVLLSDSKPEYLTAVRILVSFYGIWNLEFFKMFSLGICLDLSSLAVRALDYIIAIYPFLLSVLSYVLIKLHGRNFRVLVYLWKPFRYVFTFFRRNWNTRTSVIDAYSTFYFLSLYKIVNISFDLLVPVQLHVVGQSGEVTVKYVLFYDGTIDYFGKQHLPYAVLALVPVTLLLLYRCRCVHRLNCSCCSAYSHILNAFMDSFQGCYKDGTEPGTRDCRWFAAVDLFTRVVIYCLISFLYFTFASLAIVLVVIIFVNVLPYKKVVAHYNKIDVTFYCLIALFYTSLESTNITSIKAFQYVSICYVIAILTALTPLVYMIILSIYWIFLKKKWCATLVKRLRAWRHGYQSMDELLADRLVHPDNYTEQGLEDTLDFNTRCQREDGIIHPYTD